HTHTHTHTLTHTHTSTPTSTHIHTLTFSHSLTYSSLSHTHTHTHTYTHTNQTPQSLLSSGQDFRWNDGFAKEAVNACPTCQAKYLSLEVPLLLFLHLLVCPKEKDRGYRFLPRL